MAEFAQANRQLPLGEEIFLDHIGHFVRDPQAASRALDFKMPIRILPVADIAGESVKSFVDAEKALVNSMTRSRVHAKPAPKPKAKAPVRRAKAKVAHKVAHKAAHAVHAVAAGA